MRILLIGLWLLMSYLGVAAQHITLTDPRQQYPISYPLYLPDQQGKITFDEIKVRDSLFVKATHKVPDFLGNFSKAIWYHFEIQNSSNASDWYLEIKGGFMNDLTLYQITENGQVKSLTLNGDNNFQLRPIKSNNLIFPLTISKGMKAKIYLRATSKTLIRTSMSIGTMQKLYEDSVPIAYGDGFFTAVAVALLLYNLFVYFSLREKVYLYYIGYISTSILHINLVAGHVQTFIPWLDWLNTTTILPIVSCFSILFTNSFLQTQHNAPIIYKIRWMLIILCMAPLSVYAAGWYGQGILLSAILIFMLFIYWLSAGIIAYRNGYAPAIFYLIGFGALVVMSVIFDLKMRGWLEESYWTDSSLLIGAAIEAVVLSFALASKFNFYKKEKERLQEEAYLQAIHFSRELINIQEAERKRIAAELHDSLGQKLILIKNNLLSATLNRTVLTQKQTQTALVQNVADSIQEIRNIAYALRPYQLDLLGLTCSIESLIEESCNAAKIDYSSQTDNIDAFFDSDASINIYRIIQECVNNIIKHAAAKKISIKIKLQENQLKISIIDDGIGFNIHQPQTGFGLRGIKERLQILNGSIAVTSSTKGTRFEFLVPTTNILPHEK
jgi:signal transduction histidine kinase